MYNSRASYLPRLTVVDLENLPLKHQARKFPPKTNNSQKQSYRYRAMLREHTSTDASFSEQNPIAGTTKNPLIYLLTMVGPNCGPTWNLQQITLTISGRKARKKHMKKSLRKQADMITLGKCNYCNTPNKVLDFHRTTHLVMDITIGHCDCVTGRNMPLIRLLSEKWSSQNVASIKYSSSDNVCFCVDGHQFFRTV